MQLGQITEAKIDQAGPPSTAEFTYVDISSVDNNAKRIVEPKRLPAASAPSRARQRLRSGDVLVSMTRPNLNAVALVPPELDGAVGSTGFHVLRAREKVLPQWLYYGVQTRKFVGAMSELVQGALYPAVRPKDIRTFDLPVPELDEQRRIVAEIEKQFSRLDEAVANLERVKANLRRFRAAVLTRGSEGEVLSIPLAHALGGHQHHTGSELREQILKARRVAWEASQIGRAKYKQPAPPETEGLSPLPAGWAWITLEELGPADRACAYGVLQPGEDRESGVPFVRVGDISDGRVDIAGLKRIDPQIAAKYPRTQLEGGELLITLVGTIGRTAVAPPELKGANVARAVGVVPLVPQVDARWVEIWFRAT